MAQQFVNIDSSEFTLNGVPFDKIFIAFPLGTNHIKVVCAYESRNELLSITPVSEVEVEGVVHGTQAELISALKPVIYSPGSGSGGNGGAGGTTVYQGTVEHFLSLSGVNTNQPELDYIAEAVQLHGAFTCDEGQQMVFVTSLPYLSSDLASAFVLKRWYRLKTNATSIGGGVGLVYNDLFMPDGRIETVANQPGSGLFIDLGVIDSPNTVQGVFNLGDPNSDPSNEPYEVEGEKFITAVLDGVNTIWRFRGGNGSWGGNGGLTSTEEDFDNLSEQSIPEPSYSETTPSSSSLTSDEPDLLDLSNWEGIPTNFSNPLTGISAFKIFNEKLGGERNLGYDASADSSLPIICDRWEIKLSGTSGSSILSIGSNSYTMNYSNSIEETTDVFVSNESANILSDTGLEINSSNGVLTLLGKTNEDVLVSNSSGDLNGVIGRLICEELSGSNDFDTSIFYLYVKCVEFELSDNYTNLVQYFWLKK